MNILYSLENGEVVIITGAHEKTLWATIPTNAINPRIVQDSDIPQDRTFRDAWRDVTGNGQIVICHQTAKEIALKKLKAQAAHFIRELNIQSIEHINTPDKLLKIKNVISEIQNAVLKLEEFNPIEIVKYNNLLVLNKIQSLSNPQILEAIYTQII